jgi:pilus assembly protein CpaF
MVKASRIVTVAAAKGGSGASFIASNLAIGLGLASQSPTLLIDLDLLQGGSQASLLSLEREVENRHLGRMFSSAQPDINLLEACRVPHPKLPVHILAAPSGADRPPVNGQQLYHLLVMANALYPNIVIDAAQPAFNNLLGVCTDCSSAVLSVVIPDILSLQATSQMLHEAESRHYPLNKYQLLVNMADLSPDLSADEIGGYFQELLKRPLEYQLPFDPVSVIKAINRGVPVMQKCKNEQLVQAFVQLVKALLRLPPVDVAQIHISLAAETPVVQEHFVPVVTQAAPETKALTRVQQAVAGWSPEQTRQVKQQLHKRLLQEVKLTEMEFDHPEKQAEVRKKLRDKLAEIMLTDKIEISSRREQIRLIEEILDEALGLGPLEALLKDEQVSEVMVNGPDLIFIERRGKLELSTRQFLDERQLRVVIDRIVAPIGRRIDESSPMVDARLADGSRVNIVIPPLALDGPAISIRKFPSERLKAENLISIGSMTREMADFLRGAVEARLNILICGGTGSGKTTLLNIMSSFIPHGARIVTIEDAAELQLHQEHVIRLESRPANLEGKGQITIRDLVRNSLRMRPDRIVVGEVRGGEALDMLQAMNTGHDGSLTTCHANAPREALSRLETMVLMAGVDLPIRAIRDQIASAVDLIVHQSRLRDGTRKITHIVEICGMEGDIISTQEIFKYEQMTVDEQGHVIGRFKQADIRPSVLERFVTAGISIPACFEAGYTAPVEAAVAPVSENDFLGSFLEKDKPEKKGFFWQGR